MFVCVNCGLVHEPGEHGFTAFSPHTAAITTRLAYAGDVQYIAVWRVAATIDAGPLSPWERIKKTAGSRTPYVFVPAFSLARMVMQRLGASLTEAQLDLQLTEGLLAAPLQAPALVTDDPTIDEAALGPGFGSISPVLVGRKDAATLAHFVYLAVESYDKRELHSVDYQLEVAGEDLVFLPAVWDPRQVYESNWRLLLREFDGLVA